MKLHNIRDVLAVARCGSMRAAARGLDVVQPAITRSIREVECELGATLFERHAQGARLTVIGEAVARRSAIIESELRRIREEVDQLKGLSTGDVTVAFSLASSISLLPATLAPFYRRFPNARLKTLETLLPQIKTDLLNGEVDAYVGAVDNLTSIPAALVVEKLFDNQRVIVARKDHPAMGATSIQELASARWIFSGLASPGLESDYQDWFAKMGLEQPRTALHSRSALQTMLAVTNSDLVAMVPRQWLELPALAERICALPVVPPTAAPPVCLVSRRTVPLTPMADYFCVLIRRVSRSYRGRLDLAEPRGPSEDSLVGEAAALADPYSPPTRSKEHVLTGRPVL